MKRAAQLQVETGKPCWLSQVDPLHRSCEGPVEVFHFISKLRLRDILAPYFPPSGPCPECAGEGCEFCNEEGWIDFEGLFTLAEYDPRNAGPACEYHHRRFDSHVSPTLVVPRPYVPLHVWEFAEDWGILSEYERKFPPKKS